MDKSLVVYFAAMFHKQEQSGSRSSAEAPAASHLLLALSFAKHLHELGFDSTKSRKDDLEDKKSIK